MTIWNGLTSDGAVVPIQVDDQGRVIAVGSGPDSPLVVDGDYLRPRDATKGLGTANIDLDADGTATFAGAVICLGDPNGGATNGTRLGSTVQCGAPSGLSPVWAGYVVGTTEPTSEIKANGSATFGDTVFSGAYSKFTYTPTGEGVGVFPDGAIDLVRYNGGNKIPVLRVYNTTGTDTAPDTSPTVTINNNGDATFSGTVIFDVRSYGSPTPAIQARANTLEASDAPFTSYNGNKNGGCLYVGYGPNNDRKWYIDNQGNSVQSGSVSAKNISAFSVVLKAALLNSDTVQDLKTALTEALEELVPTPEG